MAETAVATSEVRKNAASLTSVHLGSHHSYWIVPTLPQHLRALSETLRAGDMAEIVGTGNTPKRSLWRGYRNSVMCQTAFVDGEVGAIWGLCVGALVGSTLLSDVGRPWLLTSAAAERVPIAFVKEGRAATERMLRVKPFLENYVLASYTRAVRTLRIMGFTVDEPQPCGLGGLLYSRFHKSRS